MWLKCFNGYLNSDNIDSFHIAKEENKFFLIAKMTTGDEKRLWQSLPTEEERKLVADGKSHAVRIIVEKRQEQIEQLMKGVVALLSKKEIQELKDEVAEMADEIFSEKEKKIERKAKKST